MAETTTATPQETAQPKEAQGSGEQGEQEQERTPQGSFLDPDVLLFALPVAVSIDILDVVLAMGVIANLIVGAPLLIWMVWKTGRLEAAKEQIERVRHKRQERQVARRAMRRVFLRVFRRWLFYFVCGLIPILSIFVLWTWAVINTVRGK